MVKFDINRSNLYEQGKPKEQTRKRLSEIAQCGMEELSLGEFGFRGLTSGLFIEKVWSYSDTEFNGYMNWTKELIYGTDYKTNMSSKKEIENNKTEIKGGQRLIHQLFIGKVADVLGMEKTTELLNEAKEAINTEILKMKFKDAPVGARFKYIGENTTNEVFVKIHANGDGLVAKWNGNVMGLQMHYSWVDEEEGYNFDTEVLVLE